MSFTFNDKDLVSCIVLIINDDIGTCEWFPDEDEYESEFRALVAGKNDKFIDVICSMLIDNFGFEPEYVECYREYIKMIAALNAAYNLDIFVHSKTDHSYTGRSVTWSVNPGC